MSIPIQDKALVETLAQRMGWTMRNRRTSVERFIRSAEGRSQGENSCQNTPQMTDEEIQAEIRKQREQDQAGFLDKEDRLCY